MSGNTEAVTDLQETAPVVAANRATELPHLPAGQDDDDDEGTPDPSMNLEKDVQSVLPTVTGTSPAATLDGGTPATQTLSKNQQRKLERQEKLAATKHERRAREKAARKERQAEKRRMVEEEGADPVEIGLRKKARISGSVKRPFNATIIIDLGFDDKMTAKEIKSMSTQLPHVYNVNRNSSRPVNVIMTPLNGQLEKRMVEVRRGDYLRWKGVQVLDKPISHLWSGPEGPTLDVSTSESVKSGISESKDGKPVDQISSTSGMRRENVVYLTADSKNVLSKLEENHTYVIGGIVDHNRYKNLCLNLAQDLQVQHAALPIGQYIEMASRKVLTVNQCFEIMSKWIEHNDWEKAFYEVIPKRKLDKEASASETEEWVAGTVENPSFKPHASTNDPGVVAGPGGDSQS